MRSEKFEKINFKKHVIVSQMRVLAGGDYIKYIENILKCTQKQKIDFKNYELYIFDDIGKMYEYIKYKDNHFGLSRMISGYAWEWKSKKDPNAYDIIIGKNKFRWNSSQKDWINSKNSVEEVGCIHTTQGYDLNYAGVILGNEIVYRNNMIQIIKENYHDRNGKRAIKDEDELKKYILNIYKTILTRGIKGTYIYACDQALRNYLENYITKMPDSLEFKDIVTNKIIKT